MKRDPISRFFRKFFEGSMAFLIFLLISAGSASAQPGGGSLISLSVKDVPVEQVLEKLRSQYGYSFVYKPQELDIQRNVTVEVQRKNINEVLDIVLAAQPVKYTVEAKIIHITRQTPEQKTVAALGFVNGTVLDETGYPVIGAGVILAGTTKGAITDIDGIFALDDVPADAVLTVSALGYATATVNVAGRSNLKVVLKNDSELLEDAVVVGYGSQKKVNLTGAVEAVSSEMFENRPVANVSQMLSGAVPNLNINLSDGKPNRSADYNIRGTTSIGAGGSALVLIDGVEGDPAMLNPNDIESVSVLKDAASSAIYGSRAPYGVVLITTKDPTKIQDKFSVSYSGTFSLETPTAVPDVVSDGYVYASMAREADISHRGADTFTTINKSQPFSQAWLDEFRIRNLTGNPLETTMDSKGNYIYFGNVDYYDELYKDYTFAQTHNVSVSGSNGKISHYTSARLYDYAGLFNYSPDTYRTMNIRSKAAAQILPWLKLSNNFEYTYDKYHIPTSGENSDGGNNVWRGINGEGHPSSPITNPDGTLTLAGAYSFGGFVTGNNWKDRTTRTLKNTTALNASFFKNKLNLNADFTFRSKDYKQTQKDVAIPYSTKAGEVKYLGTQEKGDYISVVNNYTMYIATNAYAEYADTFADKHNLKILVGYNYEQQDYNSLTSKSYGLFLQDLDDIAFAMSDDGKEINSSANRWRYVGSFFRVNYNYDDRYLIEINGRYDGSSKFPNNSQWGFFPSASAAWRISQEPFWKISPKAVSNLKIRASYGALGNSNVSPYTYLEKFKLTEAYSMGSGYFLNGKPITSYVQNPSQIPDNIGWETSETIDVGLDAGFWDNRIQITADYYIRRTKDMYTVGPTLPDTYGASSPKGNYADMSTYGFEVSLGYNDSYEVGGKPFNLGVKATLADYYSVIDRYNNPDRKLDDYYVGQRIGEIWGYVSNGLFQNEQQITTAFNGKPYVNNIMETPKNHQARPGDIWFLDLNDNGEIDNGGETVDNPGDRRIIGNKEPRFIYTLSLNADWNGIFFSAMFDGVGKQNWYPSGESNFWGQYNRSYNQIPTWHLGNYWTPENTDAYLPRYTAYYTPFYKGLANDRYLQDVSYIRLRNLQIGYNLPKKWISKVKLSNVSVHFSGENLWSWSPMYKHATGIDVLTATKRSDTDTNGGSRGDSMNYPTLRVFSFGLTITY